jgi:hypothetical protein
MPAAGDPGCYELASIAASTRSGVAGLAGFASPNLRLPGGRSHGGARQRDRYKPKPARRGRPFVGLPLAGRKNAKLFG